jgi:DNA polymerase V
VLAVIDNELKVKQLDRQGSTSRLRAHHPDFAVIELRPGQELQIWGVVSGGVRRLP